jgi:hypothetical protein
MLPRALLLFFALTPALHADGKFFFRRDRPSGDEPFQRAVLWYQDGEELLLIQPQLRGDATELAWVVPLPSTPLVGAVPQHVANDIFFDYGRTAEPRVRQRGLISVAIVFTILLGISIVWSLKRRSLWRLILGGVLSFVIAGLIVPIRLRGGAGFSHVEVLSSDRIGIYETEVVRASRPDDLFDWLTRNGYDRGNLDRDVIASYVHRGWCFACSRIAIEEADRIEDEDVDDEMVVNALLPPLVFLFRSDKPVYPFALTATYEEPVDVVLYVVAEAAQTHEDMNLIFAGEIGTDEWARQLLELASPDDDRVTVDWGTRAEDAPSRDKNRFDAEFVLTRLEARLSKETTPGDIVLETSPGVRFREEVWR